MSKTQGSEGKCGSSATLCGNCGKALQKPLVCARCKAATYCSKDCQVLIISVYTDVKRTHARAHTLPRTRRG